MVPNSIKVKNYAWWILIALPFALWFSGWRGAVGLILGWAATDAYFRLLFMPLKQIDGTQVAMQLAVLKSVLLRFAAIIITLLISGLLLGRAALYWTGGTVLIGQTIIVLSSFATKKRIGGEKYGSHEDR